MSDLTATLSAALDNSNVQNYLHMLSSAEGTAQASNPYAVGFGGKHIDDLSQHPGTSTTFTQTNGKQSTTSAAGAYQFQKGTWSDIQKALNLPDFGPRSQDIGALYLMHQNGSLQDVVNGNYSAAVQKDGKTWASLPSSQAAQPKRSQAYVTQALGQSGSGGPISSANAADAPGADAGDMSTVPAPKLLDAYQRAQAAQDTDAMQQLSDALMPRLQKGLQTAQSANDADAVNQIQGMIGQISPAPAGSPTAAPQGAPQANPQAAPQRPAAGAPTAPVPGTADSVGPPVSAKAPSTLDSLVSLGKAVYNHPGDVAASLVNNTKQGLVHLGQQIVADPVHAVDSGIRGLADTLTFGGADKLAALIESQKNGTSYDDELLKQRQQDQNGGTAFTAGQLGGALVPISAPIAAAKAIPTASKAARVLAGAAAGAGEGAANYLGHNDGPVDTGNLTTNAALGAVGGTLPGLTMEATQAQKASSFLRQAGGDVGNAQRDAEIVKGLSALQNRSTQGGSPLGPADANALANSYTQAAAQAIRTTDPSQERSALLNALNNARGMNDEQVNALRQLPNGDAVADAIQMRQRALSMTAPTPANTNPVLGVARTAVDNGALGLVPVAGHLLNLKSVRTAVMNVLGGRENRTGNIASALGRADQAEAFLGKYGPSQASQSAQGLAQSAQSAIAARQAAVAAAQAQRANRQAQGFIGRGQAAAMQARQQAAAGQAQAAQVLQNGQIAAQQARVQNAAQQAAAAAQARQTMANAVQGGAQLRTQAAQAVAPAQAELAAQAKAVQVAQAAQAKTAMAQRQALAETQSADPTYLLGMSNEFGAPRNPAEMSEFSKVMKAQMQADPQTQAAQAEMQAAANRVGSGQFSGLDFNKPQVQTLLSYVDHPGMKEVQQSLAQIAQQNPEMGQKIAQLLTPGARNLPKQDFYGIQAALQGIHGAKTPPQAVQAAVSQSAPALAEATSSVQNPLAYKAGIAARQAAQRNALAAAHDPEVKKLITQMSTTSKAADRAELFNDFMKGKSAPQQIEAKRVAEPLITYGR
ncbi:hypothetical protein ACPUER_11920 [Burkholderia sp. DN3021]|uniref:glycoside hydrolase family 24 protein n=1 Tax=Burkholderia sp. DN3021 TaxID=3410137 RepID=UPI003C7BC77B